MPEGDTLFRIATTLGRALTGARVTGTFCPLPALRAALEARPLAGARIDEVRARGKHLLIRFGDGRALRTHLRMRGSWHLYRAGEEWRMPPALARIALAAGGFVAVCFNAPLEEVELLSAAQLRRHERLRALGPDATSDAFDRDEALRRLRARGDDPLAVALLAQRAVAGIGNVIKAEALFLCGEHPFQRVDALSTARLAALLDAARRILLDNRLAPPPALPEPRNREGRAPDPGDMRRGGGRRTTRHAASGPRLWVYGRAGKPCLRCGARIEQRRAGDAGRSTYFCPICQSEAGAGARPS